MRLRSVLRVALSCLLLPAALRGQQVLLTPQQALKEIFPEGVQTVEDRRALGAAVRERLEKSLGRRIDEDTLVVLRVYDGAGALRGYAVQGEEIGKYRPITFMVGVTPAMAVRDVAVLVYRESRGGDVRRERFLRQYRGKTARDPVDVNRDIINISGATISVRSMNAGVKRVLAEVAALYGPPDR